VCVTLKQLSLIVALKLVAAINCERGAHMFLYSHGLAYKKNPHRIRSLPSHNTAQTVFAFPLQTTAQSTPLSVNSVMDSKVLLAFVVVAAIAVSSFAGVAFAADAPAPSPTSCAASVSSSFVAAVLCPAVALFLGNLRH
jgi:hypothetical protein